MRTPCVVRKGPRTEAVGREPSCRQPGGGRRWARSRRLPTRASLRALIRQIRASSAVGEWAAGPNASRSAGHIHHRRAHRGQPSSSHRTGVSRAIVISYGIVPRSRPELKTSQGSGRHVDGAGGDADRLRECGRCSGASDRDRAPGKIVLHRQGNRRCAAAAAVVSAGIGRVCRCIPARTAVACVGVASCAVTSAVASSTGALRWCSHRDQRR